MKTSLLLRVVFIMYFLILPATQTDDDVFKEFEIAQKEVFEWIRDGYRLHQMPSRMQRDVDAVNGDTWYKNYQIKECQTSNKSSFCNGHHMKAEKERNPAPEISEMFDELDEKDKAATWTNDGEKLQSPTHRDDAANSAGRINDKNIKLEHLFPVGPSASNYNPVQLNIEARLNAKHILAKQRNAIHEIEMKHQHLATDDDAKNPADKLKELSENQLDAASSNYDFPLTFNIDTSKRALGQQQKPRLDDQLDTKRNDLFDESDQKTSKQEQQGLQSLRRVKRDGNDGLMNRATDDVEDVTADEEFLKFLDEMYNDKHANTSNSTAKQETNDGDKSACNETSSVNNNRTTAHDAKIKRDIRHRQRAIKGRQKVSDLISGELPNDIIKAVHRLVDSNDKLKHHIKPQLSEPKYTQLKDSSKLSSVKIENMMTDLVEFINELVDDQIQMRSCIPLTPELKDFYGKLMGRRIDEDSPDNEVDDVNDEDERYERFLSPRKRFTRKVATATFNREEINEKCNKVLWFQSKFSQVPLTDEQKQWFEKFFLTHIQMCDKMKSEVKHKTYVNATQDFVKLDAYKDFVIESNLEDF